MVQYPEDYQELDSWMNALYAWVWKGILNAKYMGGDERVIKYLRRFDMGNDLRLWADEQLAAYLLDRDLSEDFNSVADRL